jgi:putative transposase
LPSKAQIRIEIYWWCDLPNALLRDMHNLPKTGNLHLIAALGHFAIEAVAAGVQAVEDRKKHRELLAEYQRLNGLGDEAMLAYRPSLEDLAEPGPAELRSPLRTRLTTPERDAVYHLSSRLSGNMPLLEDDHREMFCRMLENVAVYCGVAVLNFVVLDNHFHLLLRVPQRDSREPLTSREILRRVQVLHPDLAEMLEEALFPENAERKQAMELSGSALEHFGFRMMQGKAKLETPEESAAAWAARELKRHRGLMCELEMFVRLLKQRFSKWYNAKTERFGTLWTDRFRSMLLEDRPEVLQAVSAYIDLNAVRRGWVKEPAQYAHCGLAKAVAGEVVARQGITAVVGSESPKDSWEQLLEKHRSLIWGDLLGETAAPGRPTRYDQVPQRTPRQAVLADFFLRQHEVLLQGLALGSTRFVESVFRSNRGAFGGNGTWRGDQLILRSGLTQRWVVAGLCVLRNVRFYLRPTGQALRRKNGAFQS